MRLCRCCCGIIPQQGDSAAVLQADPAGRFTIVDPRVLITSGSLRPGFDVDRNGPLIERICNDNAAFMAVGTGP
jgi:hypothetical protein